MSDGNGSSRRKTLLTHWAPLAVTLTVATVGVAAWAWYQRSEDDEDDHDGLDYGSGGAADATTTSRSAPGAPGAAGGDDAGSSWGARVAERLRRTPSPQQVLGSAGKTVAAGVAAFGTALSSIREEDKAAFADHETWSEEADKLDRGGSAGIEGRERRGVAVVVSADLSGGEEGEEGLHASILSHIPKNVDFSTTKLYILIYAPGLKEGDQDGEQDTSAQPAEESKTAAADQATGNAAFNAVKAEALPLVEDQAMILPFTSRNGHVYILRHLQPEVVYLQESLTGDNGSAVTQIQSWLRHDIVVVVGAESGHGGLADSESEAETKDKDQKWWEREDRVGRGRGVVVVDSIRVHDDWARRVQRIE